MADSGWNPLRMYNKFKESSQGVMPFWDRFFGIMIMFSGHVFDPNRVISTSGTPIIDLNAKINHHHGSNQWGLYDYLTFRIPRTIEDICLGNWFASSNLVRATSMLLTFPIWIPLVLIRYGLGLICAIFSTPVIGAMYLYDEHMEKLKEVSAERVDVTKIENSTTKDYQSDLETYKNSLDIFNQNYKKAKSDAKNELSNEINSKKIAYTAGVTISDFFKKYKIKDTNFEHRFEKLEAKIFPVNL